MVKGKGQEGHELEQKGWAPSVHGMSKCGAHEQEHARSHAKQYGSSSSTHE